MLPLFFCLHFYFFSDIHYLGEDSTQRIIPYSTIGEQP